MQQDILESPLRANPTLSSGGRDEANDQVAHLILDGVLEIEREGVFDPGPRISIDEEIFVTETVHALSPRGALFSYGMPRAPYTSIAFGSAGVAYALYRLASRRGSTELISWADQWLQRSLRDGDDPAAFCNDDQEELTSDALGRISPYYSRSGLHIVEALIGHASHDPNRQRQGLAGFVETSRLACPQSGLTRGRTGTLLGAALLREALGSERILDELANQTLDDLWRKADAVSHITDGHMMNQVGIAHGWAGLLYATLRWCQVSGRPRPDGLPGRLRELEALAEPHGDGLRWLYNVRLASHEIRPSDYRTGWCDGAAGLIFLFTLAHRVLGDDRYLELARGAGRFVLQARDTSPSLCCGLAGQGYALLNLYRHTGEEEWLEGARQKVRRGLARPYDRCDPLFFSLYKGPVGLALLAEDLAAPEAAGLPMFESEGWPASDSASAG